MKFVEDKNDIQIFFIISESEKKKFSKIISKYKNNISINVLFIEDLFDQFAVQETAKDYLAKYGRYTFQTAKKFYSMLAIDSEKFLVLDCESMWVKPTNMMNLFENYFQKPCLVASSVKTRKIISSDLSQMLENVNRLLEFQCDKWFLENFIWFYEKNILLNLFAEHGCFEKMVIALDERNKNLDVSENIRTGIFEIILYQNYLYKNKERYGYRIIEVEDELKKYLEDKDLETFYEKFYNVCKGNCGYLEHAVLFLTNKNVRDLALIFKENNFNIIRCDSTNLKNYKLQTTFMNIVKPNILAASQDHAFGMNSKLCIFKSYRKVLNILKNI